MQVVERFIVIVSAVVLATLMGYLSRKKGWLPEESAGKIILYSVLLFWTPSSLLVLWKLELSLSLIVLPVFYPLQVIFLLPIGYFIVKLLRGVDSRTVGTLFIAMLISNIGFTMGGFVCFCLYGMVGLAYTQLYCASWTIPIIGFGYPIARRFGETDKKLDFKFIVQSLIDIRALPVVGTIAGLGLNIWGIEPISAIYEFHIVDVFVIIAILSSFFTIGLQLHFSSIKEYRYFHVILSLVKFVISPLIAIILLGIIQYMFFDIPDLARKVIIIESLTPTAIFTVIIATLFNLRPRLAGILFVVNTIIFLIIVLPVVIAILE